MHLTLHADYALRVLLYLSAHPTRQVSTGEISEAYGISKNHLVRVVQELGKLGYVDVRPGRSGGLALAREPSEVRVGEVIRRMEPHMNLLECFDPAENTCPIMPACGLKHALVEARDAFLAVLDKLTLADVIQRSSPALPSFFLLTKPLDRAAR
jgi:Rrf2 family nitric oxide-sensitive transcriptional repressor